MEVDELDGINVMMAGAGRFGGGLLEGIVGEDADGSDCRAPEECNGRGGGAARGWLGVHLRSSRFVFCLVKNKNQFLIGENNYALAA